MSKAMIPNTKEFQAAVLRTLEERGWCAAELATAGLRTGCVEKFDPDTITQWLLGKVNGITSTKFRAILPFIRDNLDKVGWTSDKARIKKLIEDYDTTEVKQGKLDFGAGNDDDHTGQTVQDDERRVHPDTTLVIEVKLVCDGCGSPLTCDWSKGENVQVVPCRSCIAKATKSSLDAFVASVVEQSRQ